MNRYFKILLGILAVLVLTGASTTWNSAFEGTPAATDPFVEGPTRMQETKENVRKRLQVEHRFGTTSTDDNGLHHIGSSRCFVQDAAPTAIALADFLVAGGTATLSDDESSSSTSPATKLGHGRCWIDPDGLDGVVGTPDDFLYYIYDQDPDGDADYSDAAWVVVDGANVLLGQNVAGCGGFECMDAASTSAPSMGQWSLDGTPTMTYATTLVTEGLGLEMIASSTVTGEGILLELDGLRTSATYVVAVRTQLTSGTGTCALKTANMTTGSGVDLAEITSASATYATLRGIFSTGTSLNTSPQIELEVNVTSGTVVCSWDHVSVREVRGSFDEVRRGGNVVQAVTYSGATNIDDSGGGGGGAQWADADNPLMAVSITVPDDGYYIRVTGALCFGWVDTNDNSVLAMRLTRAGTEVARAINGQPGGGTNSQRVVTTLNVNYVDLDPAPGTTYTYEIDANGESDGGGATDFYTNPGASGAGASEFGAGFEDSICDSGVPSYLIVEAIRSN